MPEAEIKKLLIVEDDPGVLEMTSDHFKGKGYVVLTANNVEEGWRTAYRERPDGVLLDYNLPDHTGEELLKRIKKNLPHIQVVIISACDDEKIKEQLMKSGAAAFFEKGDCSISNVEKNIKKLLDEAGKIK